MKKVLLACLASLSVQAFATVDGLTSAWIVTQNVQDSEDFGIMSVAVMGCWGVAQGPELVQFTAEHKIASSMGCGQMPNAEPININALSCATTSEAIDNDDYMSYRKITLDLSKCPYRENKKFLTMIRMAARRNFPQTKNGKPDKNREVELVLLK